MKQRAPKRNRASTARNKSIKALISIRDSLIKQIEDIKNTIMTLPSQTVNRKRELHPMVNQRIELEKLLLQVISEIESMADDGKERGRGPTGFVGGFVRQVN